MSVPLIFRRDTGTAADPDNLKSGVSKACRYDPELNPSYQRWPSTIRWR